MLLEAEKLLSGFVKIRNTKAISGVDSYSSGPGVRFITFLPRSKRLLISWLQSPSTVILEPRNIKSDTVSPSIAHEVAQPDRWGKSGNSG